jgi:hypothetical protein
MSIYHHPEPLPSHTARTLLSTLVPSAGGDTRKQAIIFDPIPDLDSPRALALDYLRVVARHYLEAERRRREAWKRYEDWAAHSCQGKEDEHYEEARRWETWCGLHENMKLQAEQDLKEAILVAHGRIGDWKDVESLGGDWPACSVELDMVVFSVSQDPEYTEAQDAAKPILVVVDTTLHADADWREA